MNFFQIEFLDGSTLEFKNLDNEKAINQAHALMKRWNQPGGTVFRCNPFNGKEKFCIYASENEHYNPEAETHNEDQVKLVPGEGAYKKASKKRKKRSGSGSGSSKNSGPRVSHKVPLKEIADKMEMDATAIRRKLRKSEIEKPEGGWGWDSWEAPEVKEILSWEA